MDPRSAFARAVREGVRDAASSMTRVLAERTAESAAVAFLVVLLCMLLVRGALGRHAFEVLQATLLACLLAVQSAAAVALFSLAYGNAD